MSYDRPADLFAGTARYYARYRAGYPLRFVEHIAGRFGLDIENPTGRLLDLGCGTGQLILSLAHFFEDAIGVDPSLEMLAEAAFAAERLRVHNVRWIAGGSEDLPRLRQEIGALRLVVMGSSFHWMDQDQTLRDLYEMIEPGGGVVISSSSFNLWSGERPWQEVAKAIIQRWLGEERRAGSGNYRQPHDPFEAIIARSPFAGLETYHLPRRRTLDVEQIVGLVYSTSFCSPDILGERRAGFERDLREGLYALDRTGSFIDDITIGAYLTRKPRC